MTRRIASLLCAGAATFVVVSFALAVQSTVKITSQSDARITYHVLTAKDQLLQNITNYQRQPESAGAGSGFYIAPDAPILPSTTSYFEIRSGTNPVVRVKALSVSRVLVEKPPSTFNFSTDKMEAFSAKSGDKVYPPEMYSIGEPVSFRGRTLFPVTVYPIQYDSHTQEYIRNTDIEVTLAGDFQPDLAQRSGLASPVYSKIFSTLTNNPPGRDDIAPNLPSGSYVVVAREECLPFAIPLIEWKRQAGFGVTVLTYSAGNSAANVKEDIQNIYDRAFDAGEEPFEYLLIIGDREENHKGAPWTFPSFYGEPSMERIAPHADYIYGLLDNPDDPVMDVAVGRITAGDTARMELAVNRQLSYERTPNMDNPDFFISSGVFSQYWGDDGLNREQFYTVNWGEQALWEKGFRGIQRYDVDTADVEGDAVARVMAQWLNRGVNVWIGRAQIRAWNNGLAGVNVNQNRNFPFGINMTGHGEFSGEWVYGDGDGENLKGAVVWTTGWGTPVTVYSNGVWQTLVDGVINNDLPIGWARTLIGLEWQSRFPHGSAQRGVYQTDIDLYGDPGLQPWTTVPKQVEISHVRELTVGMNYLVVHVTEQGSNDPVENALVTLYSPGNIPEPARYPDHEPLLQMTGRTDAAGRVSFDIADGLPVGRLFITATGRNICPVWEQLNLQPGDPPNLTVESVQIVQGEARAGTQCTIRVTVANNGGSEAFNVNGIARSRSAHVQIDDVEINFGDIRAGGRVVANRDIQVTFDRSTPNEFVPELVLWVNSRGDSSTSLIRMEVSAPKLSVENIEPSYRLGDEIILFPGLVNSGRATYEGGTATLVSNDWRLDVIDGSANYPRVAPGQAISPSDGDRFIVRSKPGAIPGPDASLMMIIRSNDAVVDTLQITFALGHEVAGRGPEPADAYGYTCLDNSDTAWIRFPFSVWDEIYPEDDGGYAPGRSLLTAGNGQASLNVAVVVALDFPFRFYGQTYDSITVCSNGFISVGSQTRQVNFENVRMELATGGAAGMIAPFWDVLTLQPNGERPNGVYGYFDSTFHRYIIEWYELHPMRSLETSLNFQVQILDSRYYPTATGDCPILFQYKNIINYLDVRDEVRFASVGISSPDGTTGLGVNFDSSGTAYTPLVRSRSQLLFTTTPKATSSRSGGVNGIVVEPDGSPLRGEPVKITAFGLGVLWQTTTDDNGRFRFADVLPGHYDLEIRRVGYNPVKKSISIVAGGQLDERIVVTHPNITFSYPYTDREWIEQRDSLRSPPPYLILDTGIYIRNRGNGPLNYFTRVTREIDQEWFRISTGKQGVIQAGEIKALEATINTYGLREEIDTTYFGFLIVTDTVSGISARLPISLNLNPNNGIPQDDAENLYVWSLGTNYPNPFNASTRIEYSIATTVDVKLNLFDTQGRLARNLTNGNFTPGKYSVILDAIDLSPGLYLLRMEAGEFKETRKIVLVK